MKIRDRRDRLSPDRSYSRSNSRILFGNKVGLRAVWAHLEKEGTAALDDVSGKLRFRREVLPHLDAAYNLARWIVGSDSDAQDVVQEAVLRALKSFDQWRGGAGNARAWLLTIVRNCSYTRRQSVRRQRDVAEFDESSHIRDDGRTDPGAILLRQLDGARVRDAIASLPEEYREAIVLREFEQLDYKKMAAVMGVPIGTVMSRLSRARERLRSALQDIGEGG